MIMPGGDHIILALSVGISKGCWAHHSRSRISTCDVHAGAMTHLISDTASIESPLLAQHSGFMSFAARTGPGGTQGSRPMAF